MILGLDSIKKSSVESVPLSRRLTVTVVSSICLIIFNLQKKSDASTDGSFSKTSQLLAVNSFPYLPRINENLNIFELVTLNKLKATVEDEIGFANFQQPVWTSTSFLINLLESSQWNLKKAQTKFQKAMKWRRNTAVNHPNASIFNDFNLEFLGYDRENCPIVLIPFGEWRTFRSFVEKTKSIPVAAMEFANYFAHTMEHILQRMKKDRDNEASDSSGCSQFTLIVDMQGYTFLHTSGIKFFIEALKSFEKNYPALLKIALIINSTPDFLSDALRFKFAIPWDLRQKSFLFTEKRFWESVLVQTIDESELPQKYGGSNIFL